MAGTPSEGVDEAVAGRDSILDLPRHVVHAARVIEDKRDVNGDGALAVPPPWARARSPSLPLAKSIVAQAAMATADTIMTLAANTSQRCPALFLERLTPSLSLVSHTIFNSPTVQEHCCAWGLVPSYRRNRRDNLRDSIQLPPATTTTPARVPPPITIQTHVGIPPPGPTRKVISIVLVSFPS